MTGVRDGLARHAADVLSRGGFERVLDLPVEPSGARGTPEPARTIEVDGDRWPVRDFGSDARLVRPSWPGRGVGRVYTLGWGLTPDGQTSCLVLAEAVGHDATVLRPEADAVARELSDAGFVTRVVVEDATAGVVARVAAYPAGAAGGRS